MNYDTATVLAFLCYQTDTSSIADALKLLNSTSPTPTWEHVADYINWYKNEANEWSEFWEPPFREDFTVAELRALAKLHEGMTLLGLENITAEIDGEQ